MSLPLRDYYELCKPRVVALMIVTSIIAMLLATPHGDPFPWFVLIVGNIGIALVSFSGGVVNQLIDRHIDAKMARTLNRPLPTGRVKVNYAIIFALVLAGVGVAILYCFINPLTALLSFITVIGYAIIYTRFLKRATPQNIVIGGLAGAMPPLLGWTAITGHLGADAWLLVIIIFVWTPPHFWALSIYRLSDYEKADIPMLPVIYGVPYTKLCILLYTILLAVVTYLPFALDMSGLIYLCGVTVLNILFLYHAIKLYKTEDRTYGWKTFKFSIHYLFLLFIVLLIDHYIPLLT